MNDKTPDSNPANKDSNTPLIQAQEQAKSHPIATGLGVTSGGIAGAALGNIFGGKVGAAVGGVTGAIAGSIASNALAEFAEAVIEETSPTLGLGANAKPVKLLRHYSWNELQALSKADV